MSNELANWFANGWRGASADTMAEHITGVDCGLYWGSYPLDPDDFRRCRLLVEQVPEVRDGLLKMRTASPQWAALVDHWDSICEVFDEEVPDRAWARRERWSAPKTYRLMHDLIKEAIK